jgi:hypothetical protein
MERTPRLTDPEYGIKLAKLRKVLATQPGQRPLALLMGSSRVETGIRPDCLSDDHVSRDFPLVFNFGIGGSGPVLQLLYLHRLLDDGIHPDWIFIEIWWPQLADLGWTEADAIELSRLQARDLDLLARYHSEPSRVYDHWWKGELVPWWSRRRLLMNKFAPSWVDGEHRIDMDWQCLDGLGWVLIPQWNAGPEDPGWRQWTEDVIKGYSGCFGNLPINPKIDAALREMLETCSRQGIRTALLLMPDRFRDYYVPPDRTRIDGFLERLSRQYGACVLDTRDWADDTEFHDGTHLTPQSAAVYSARLGRELIQPLLAGQKVAQVQTGR